MDAILKNLENLEESKNSFISHAYDYAIEVFGEIDKIEYNSSVNLEKDKYIRMLQIIINKKTEDEKILKEKMALYIDNITKDISKSMKENDNISDINKRIERYVSTQELLRVITDYDLCQVKAYKIDINKSNRKYIKWEDVIINNSGGEKFVVFFTLLIALISYSRSASKINWMNNKNSTKILIMDNPFGAITSGHLLKPVFEIANKYKTQLICLSDIKQSTVMEQFKLVYMIKIMQSSTRQGDYLQIEKIENGEMTINKELLEKAKLYYETTQTSLFDE